MPIAETINKENKILKEIREWVEAFVIAFILAMIIKTFLFQLYKIPSGSMQPTLKEGDRVIVSKCVYGAKVPFTRWRLPALAEPKIGDPIVFIYPQDESKHFVKRLVAKGGDIVEIRDGSIYVNGKRLDEPTVFRNTYYYNEGEYGQRGQRIEVPKGYFYVLGDNSASSRDSRYWGFVPEENLVGKPVFRIWPLNRWGKIK